MNIIETNIPDVLIFEPKVFGDERGFFFESYNKKDFEVATGIKADFVPKNKYYVITRCYKIKNFMMRVHLKYHEYKN